MASAADRFSKLEKLAILLIALGEERTREILADVDVNTLQHLNGDIAALGDISASEKAAVML
jgi:flagellar motor switch protein FliG